MPGASEQAQRVKILNANWVPGTDGGDGRFEIMIVTADDERHTLPASAASVTAVVALAAGRHGHGVGSAQPDLDRRQRRGPDAVDRPGWQLLTIRKP